MSKRVTFDDGRYTVGLGMGSWAKSIESHEVEQGDVRLVGGRVMFAYRVSRGGVPLWRWWEAHWVPVDDADNSPEKMRAWELSL